MPTVEVLARVLLRRIDGKPSALVTSPDGKSARSVAISESVLTAMVPAPRGPVRSAGASPSVEALRRKLYPAGAPKAEAAPIAAATAVPGQERMLTKRGGNLGAVVVEDGRSAADAQMEARLNQQVPVKPRPAIPAPPPPATGNTSGKPYRSTHRVTTLSGVLGVSVSAYVKAAAEAGVMTETGKPVTHANNVILPSEHARVVAHLGLTPAAPAK